MLIPWSQQECYAEQSLIYSYAKISTQILNGWLLTEVAKHTLMANVGKEQYKAEKERWRFSIETNQHNLQL